VRVAVKVPFDSNQCFFSFLAMASTKAQLAKDKVCRMVYSFLMASLTTVSRGTLLSRPETIL
jgi:hypothetical protein